MNALASSHMRGAFAGGVATLAMSAVLIAGQRAGLFREHPPEEIVEHASGREKPWPVVHLAVGFAFGVPYALVERALPPLLAGATGGTAYGVGLWLVNYAAVAPVLGLMPPAPRDDTGRQVTNIVSHVVYGATLGYLLRRWAQHEPPPEQ